MKKLGIALLTTLLFISSFAQAQNSPKREFRGAWIHTVGNSKIKTLTMEQVKALFIGTLDTLKMTGCNAVIFQVRPQADAFYISELEPWSRFLSGTQGVAPEPVWDPLEFMVEECHKRGMELHAWCNPYRVTSNDKEELSPDHLYFKHPEIFKRYGKQLYFDPGEPLSISHTKKVIADIVSRYDIDAIHFDDYFYPYPERFEEFHDDASFVKYAKEQGFEYWEKNDWRRNNVTTLIRELNDTIKAIKPWVRFGISPFGIHRNLKDTPDSTGSNTNGLSNYDQLFADVPGWAVEGIIDYVVPQLYWVIGHAVADYDLLIHWWNNSNFTDHLYIGQNISSLHEPDLINPETTQLARKMELERSLPNVHGNVWWPGWSFNRNHKGITDSIATKYQANLALIPPYSKLDSIAPEKVIKLTKTSHEFRWESAPTEDKLQEPMYYALYIFPEGTPVDIENTDYLVTITKDKFYKFDKKSKPKKGSTIAVTVIDRCWNESESFLLTL